MATTAPSKTRAKFALAALICGLFALIPNIGLILGIIAIVLGFKARKLLKQSPTLKGKGMAHAGIALGWVGVIITIVAFAVSNSNGDSSYNPFEDLADGSVEGGGNGDSASASSPSFISTPTSNLVLVISDMPAGWLNRGGGPQSIDEPGFNNGYSGSVAKASGSGNSANIYRTHAYAFNSTAEADAYYEELKTTAQGQFSTSSRSYGDEAFYYEITSSSLRADFRIANVVWVIEMDRQGFMPWDPDMDWIADTMSDKA